MYVCMPVPFKRALKLIEGALHRVKRTLKSIKKDPALYPYQTDFLTWDVSAYHVKRDLYIWKETCVRIL